MYHYNLVLQKEASLSVHSSINTNLKYFIRIQITVKIYPLTNLKCFLIVFTNIFISETIQLKSMLKSKVAAHFKFQAVFLKKEKILV